MKTATSLSQLPTALVLEGLVRKARNETKQRLGSWIKRGIKAFSYHAGLNPAFQRLVSRRAVTLFYHKVQRRPAGLWGEPALSVQEFDAQLSYLTRHYEVVPLTRIVRGLKGEATLPDRAVALTFDDGYRNNLLLAAPLLKRHHVPATFFITTGLIGTDQWMWAYELEEMFLRFSPQQVGLASGHPAIADLCRQVLPRHGTVGACVEFLKNLPHDELLQVMRSLRSSLPVEVDDENRFMSWDEVRALQAEGFEIGAHTVTHPILPRLSLAEAEREVAQSRSALEEALGVRPTLFAYPNGDTTPALSQLAGRYFEAAVTTQPGTCSATSSMAELPRVGAPVELPELSFELTRHLLAGDSRPGTNQLRRDDQQVREALSARSQGESSLEATR